jgi:hypothetical protein
MTNLSPAALAVLWAGLGRDSDRLVIAAALRAAAEHLSYQLPFEDWDRVDVFDLLAIANELEAND